jgi:hypothetical protein
VVGFLLLLVRHTQPILPLLVLHQIHLLRPIPAQQTVLNAV